MKYGYTINNKLMANSDGKLLIKEDAFDPYNPLDLPSNTIRVRTNDGQPPIKDSETSYETAILVSGTNDVYDVYKSGTSFAELLNASSNVIEVLGANTTGITNMVGMFRDCTSLTTVPLFDTTNVVRVTSMFAQCSVLTSIPLFDTSKVEFISFMFRNCYKVESGSLELYRQVVSQGKVLSYVNHNQTFRNCGRDTETGSAELAQIPDEWK